LAKQQWEDRQKMAKSDSGDDDTLYLNSLRRGLQSLEYLNRHDFVSATELSHYLDVPRTTARRVLDTLVLEGYLCKIPQDCRYHITPAVAALSRGLNDEALIVDAATPLLEKKTKEIGWAFHITVQRDENMLLRAESGRFSPHVIRRFKVGCKGPIIYSAAGHVMLSFLPGDKRRDLVTKLKTSCNPINHAVREGSFVAIWWPTRGRAGMRERTSSPGPNPSSLFRCLSKTRLRPA